MTLQIRVTRRAAREIERVAQWWSVNRTAAPGAVRTDLKATFDVLREQPGIGVRVEDARFPETRRIHLDRIQYWVYYRVRGGQLEVLSVWHSSRGSTPLV